MTEPLGGAAGRTSGRAIGRRGIVMLALLTAGGLAAASSSTWLQVLTWTPLAEATSVAVPGTQAAPTVGAAAFVVATGAVALALARGRGVFASAGIGLGGVLAAGSAARILMEPDGVAAAAARAAVGVGVTSGPPDVTGAPWLALAMGVLGVALAGIAFLASRGWSPPTARHVAAGDTPVVGDAVPTDQWDALSRGEDPTA